MKIKNQNNSASRTPGPWTCDCWQYDSPRGERFVIQNKQDAVAELIPLYRPDCPNRDEESANALFIVKACNEYGVLCSILEEAKDTIKAFNKCRANVPTELEEQIRIFLKQAVYKLESIRRDE